MIHCTKNQVMTRSVTKTIIKLNCDTYKYKKKFIYIKRAISRAICRSFVQYPFECVREDVRQFEMLSKQFLAFNEASMTAISHKNREREKFPPFVGDVVVK